MADSVALDPHKTLFLPYGTGAVARPRRQAAAGRVQRQPAITSGRSASPKSGPSPADLSPELTRHFRALRLWLPLQIAGVAAFRAAQSEKLALARYFHARLSEIEASTPAPSRSSRSSPSATSRRRATPTSSTSA